MTLSNMEASSRATVADYPSASIIVPGSRLIPVLTDQDSHTTKPSTSQKDVSAHPQHLAPHADVSIVYQRPWEYV